MSQRTRTLLLWVVLISFFLVLFNFFSSEGDADFPKGSVAAFEHDLGAGTLALVQVDEHNGVFVTTTAGTRYQVPMAYDQPLADRLEEAGVRVQTMPPKKKSFWVEWLPPILIGGLVLGLLLAFLRARQQGTNSIFSLRKSPARLVAQLPNVRWDDVGGQDETKARLRQAVDALQKPEAYAKAGAVAPRGVLLEGPPGFGKTMLAKALAAEAKLPFFETSASEFVELFVGVGAARVRDLFEAARAKAPCIVFIDELDAVGRKRGGSASNVAHQEREQALDELLVALDGFRDRGRVLVVAATNRADVLDPALLRPGRFDVVLRVGAFDIAGRRSVLLVHTKGKPLGPDVKVEELARASEGLSGAELAQVCNDAALRAARRAAESGAPALLTQADFDAALKERRTTTMTTDQLDLLLAEASAGLVRPALPVRVVVQLMTGVRFTGEVLWADAAALKVETADGPVVLQRAMIQSLRSVGAAPVEPALVAEAAAAVPDAMS